MKRRDILLGLLLALMLLVAVAPAAAQQYISYVTQPGDTLSKIAVRYCTTWQEIYNINRQAIGDNPDALFAGKVLTIPNRCGSGAQPPAGGSGVYDRGQRTHATGTVQGNVYVVAWGDTLFSIGQRFGLSSDVVASANSVEDTNALVAGQRLLIPGLQGSGAVLPPVVRPPTTASRTFAFGECTVVFNSATNIWNTPNGSVIASIGAGSSPAQQVQRVNSVLWYQIEYIETNPWVPAYLVGTVGNCGL
ncbi:MAG: LysM peptidoglycan-binding domain-containing protein [Anaerolineae bacterium]|nr:LysM peptidoglycan-binding domain-containing protein [Anaerolineae bacterium]MCA9909222.1 LysM peptidoglycan-binding domain-containing protein [Anaerolineae bacterium]